MNHLEEGIEEASTVAATALETSQASSAKIDSISDLATTAAQKVEEANNLATEAKTLANDSFLEADEAFALAAEARASAVSAKESADGALSKVESKQDLLESGSNIKTLNGESLLGSGDIKVAVDIPFSVMSEGDLDELKEQGAYKIESALNYPEGTSASGTLHVNKLGDSHYEQL